MAILHVVYGVAVAATADHLQIAVGDGFGVVLVAIAVGDV